MNAYLWSRLYASAILETDRRKLPKRIKEAERAIRQRLDSTTPINDPEQSLLVGAESRLKELKQIRDSTRYLGD